MAEDKGYRYCINYYFQVKKDCDGGTGFIHTTIKHRVLDSDEIIELRDKIKKDTGYTTVIIQNIIPLPIIHHGNNN